MSNIFDYPPVERKYVAVRKYRQAVGGEKIFNRLLSVLGLTYYEFVDKYGEKLIGDPAPDELNRVLVEMLRRDFRSVRK
nr:hypothetical protein [uncultured Methanobrevibacter sp.]